MNEELQELVRSPREDLDIELKQWMDADDKVVQAKFAKELLALRNHGGGYLVLGFTDDHPAKADASRPSDVSVFSTDYFNNIIKRYAEPPFHCMANAVAHPVTGECFPVVVVPGGAKVPVRCKSDSPDGGKTIKVDTYYVRRPGPESAPLQSGAEWDVLLQRCMLGRKEELVAALASLLGAGQGSGLLGLQVAPRPEPFAELRAFRDAAVAKLEAMQAKLPLGDGARFTLGRYVLSARIVGELKAVSPGELLELLSGLKKYTGWSPLNVFQRTELAPYPVADNVIECWLARDEARDAGHADFWRVSAGGMVTLIRGYQEDSTDSVSPGKGFELTLPPWRLAEFMLRVRDLGGKLAVGPFRLQMIAEWEGLKGRRLFSHGGRRLMLDEYVAHEPTYRAEFDVSTEDVDSGLETVVSAVVTPLLRRFSFFEPPSGFYEQELDKFMRREFV
jgi:hypothetical protein